MVLNITYVRLMLAKILIGSFVYTFWNEKKCTNYGYNIFGTVLSVLMHWKRIAFWNTLCPAILGRMATARVVICRDVRRISASRL